MAEQASIKEIMAFFEMTPREMTKEWKVLSDESKEQLKNGIGDGSLTY